MLLGTALLIQYGRLGFVGRFRSAFAHQRGDRIVVRGPRGIELGEVLLPVAGAEAETDGELLRGASPEDETHAAESQLRSQALLAAATEGAAERGLPLAFVDVEVTLDGFAILHALPWDACDATPLLEELGTRFGFAVRLLDLTNSPNAKEEPSHGGCGKPGCGTESGGCSSCGTGSGGCSSGSCSRDSVKDADELTAHFAELRRKMEAAGLARTPLN